MAAECVMGSKHTQRALSVENAQDAYYVRVLGLRIFTCGLLMTILRALIIIPHWQGFKCDSPLSLAVEALLV